MNKYAICTAFYEAARPFLADYFAGVEEASRGHEVALIIANDGFSDVETALSGAPDNCTVNLVSVREKTTPAGVRRFMLQEAYRSGAEFLIFADVDDILCPKALDRHLLALEDAAFSYGDMELLDEEGTTLGRRFFDDAGIPPQCLESKEIAARNYLGFSNTAVRRRTLSAESLSLPDNVACADWWFYSVLIAAGWRGRRTSAPVAGYRLHRGSTLGAGPPKSAAQARAQAKMLNAHLDSLAEMPGLKLQRQVLMPGFDWLASAGDREVEVALTSLAGTPGVWFEHLSKLLAEKSKPLLAAGLG